MSSKGRWIAVVLWLSFHWALSAVSLAGPEPSVSGVTWKSEDRRVVQVRDGERTVDLELRGHAIEVVLEQGGEPTEARIVSLFDPQTGLFLWTYLRGPDSGLAARVDRFLDESSFYCSKERVARATLLRPAFSLWLSESTRKYATRELAYRGLGVQLEQELRELGRGRGDAPHQVLLGRRLQRDFHTGPLTVPSGMFAAEITDLARDEAGWTFWLRGYGDQAAVVTVNSDYELLDIVRKQPGD